jgi:hypothetical protein
MVMEGRQVELESCFASVQKVASVYHPYSMPYEHFDVFYCRTPVQSHSFPVGREIDVATSVRGLDRLSYSPFAFWKHMASSSWRL